jgi:hypothetical protein
LSSWASRRKQKWIAPSVTPFGKPQGHPPSYWLLEYLFTETAILFTPQKVVCLATHRKSKSKAPTIGGYIAKIQEPAHYKGPKIVTVERGQNAADLATCQQLLKEAFSAAPGPVVLATCIGDKPQGTFAESFSGFLKAQETIKLVDVTKLFLEVLSVKCPPEQVL